MKKYIMPVTEKIGVSSEAIMGFGSPNDKIGEDGGIGGFAKRDEFLLEDGDVEE